MYLLLTLTNYNGFYNLGKDIAVYEQDTVEIMYICPLKNLASNSLNFEAHKNTKNDWTPIVHEYPKE